MAEYVVTPANVLASGQAQLSTGTAGASITAGQALYQDVDGSMKLYDANGASPLNVMKGIALHASLTGQPIVYARADPSFQPGFTLVVGDTVIGSATTPGSLCPESDKASGWFITNVGIAISTTKMKLAILASGVVR
jgi:hypothetical protein